MSGRRFVRLEDHFGMTMVELSIVILILGVLLVLAVATLWRARLAGNEASAISSLRTIHKAQFAYAVECGRGNYATSLVILGTKPSGSPYAFLNEDLGSVAAPTRSGYTIEMRLGLDGSAAGNDCRGNATQTQFYASAAPVDSGTGTRAFAINQGGAIWQLVGVTPPAEPFGAPAKPAY